jgi:phosphatidate cytidylyltransferase
VFIDEYLIPFARHHRFISLLMYLLGFLGFVTNLDRGHLRRQFGLFSWIHMSLLLIIVFGQFMVNNILEGLIWFWVPASLVIMNDVAAYVFGIFLPSASPLSIYLPNADPLCFYFYF